MDRQCINCKFYLTVNDATGQCRLNPPVFAVMADNSRKWLWPGVAVDHWCGQYVTKEIKESAGRSTDVSVEGQDVKQSAVPASPEPPKSGSES